MQTEKLGTTVLTLNAIATVGAMASSVVALIDPTVVLPSTDVTPGIEMYAQVYAARAIPLGAALLFALTSKRKRALLPLLAVSGTVQLGDVLIGAAQHLPGMIVGGTIGATIHLATVGLLVSRQTRRSPVSA